jgi:hypothetical protein
MMIEVIGKCSTAVIRQFRGLPDLHSPRANNAAWDLIAEFRPESLITSTACCAKCTPSMAFSTAS